MCTDSAVAVSNVSQAILNAVANIVNGLCAKQSLFTYRDVTQLVRQAVGTSIDVPHRDVRNAVLTHSMPADYMKTLVNIVSGDIPCSGMVYHPVNIDAYTEYDPQVIPECPKVDMSSPAPVSAVGVSNGLDGEKRLNIPKKLLKQISAVSADKIHVCKNDDKMVLTKIDVSDKNDHVETLNVNANGAVRVSDRILCKVFSANDGGYEFEVVDGREIHVSS
ncbi:hypothetical protein KAR91_42250 [Candidatus Pacearchaeota archaeon]|nr:hypothetical protein [Candidatus Pacearchaeota archaeon]